MSDSPRGGPFDRLRSSAALWSLIGTIGLLVFWEVFVRVRDVRKFVLLPPSEIVTSFADTPGFFLGLIGDTAWHLVVGLAISLLVSLSLGALLTAVRPLEHATQPLLVLIMVTPWVAYISSIVLFVGRGTPAIVFLVAFVTTPAFVYATIGGMRGADPAARELLASIDASRWEVLRHLRLPAALPALFTAARFNVGLGLGAAYFAEGATFNRMGNGLGEAGKRAASSPSLDAASIMWTTILCAALLGIVSQVVVVLLERWLLRWHVSQRR